MALRDYNKIQNIIGLILLLFLAAVFFFSGISKLYTSSSLEAFTWHIANAGLSNLTLASIIARLLIGLEILVGMLLLFHISLKKITFPLAISLLSIFSLYLIYIIFQQGNKGDCGCFGDAISMKPITALVKNGLLLLLTFYLLKFYSLRLFNINKITIFIFILLTFSIPFVAQPFHTDERKPEIVHEHIDLQPLYISENPRNKAPKVELRKGKHIIAFLSLTCPHCRKAAFELQIIHEQHPEIPIFFVLNGNPLFLKDFYEETHAEKIKNIHFFGPDEMMEMAGPMLPAIYWVNNSTIERKSNYYQLDPKLMLAWLHSNK